MARERRSNSKSAAADRRRPQKKKISILNTEQVEWIDYKDVNLLRRFMSERAKIRARRVTGNSTQQQRQVAKAIRLAREMALLPYSVRQVTQRKGGRRDRGDRGELREEMPPRPSEPVESDYVAEVEVDEVDERATDVDGSRSTWSRSTWSRSRSGKPAHEDRAPGRRRHAGQEGRPPRGGRRLRPQLPRAPWPGHEGDQGRRRAVRVDAAQPRGEGDARPRGVAEDRRDSSGRRPSR